jgi:hypothetical protein
MVKPPNRPVLHLEAILVGTVTAQQLFLNELYGLTGIVSLRRQIDANHLPGGET